MSRVLLPIAWPDIWQAMRLGFGVGWSYILLAEMVDVGSGLGGIIITSQRRGPREHIYLVLLVIVVVAFFTDRLWAGVGRFLFPLPGAEGVSALPPPVIEFKGVSKTFNPGTPRSSRRSRTSTSRSRTSRTTASSSRSSAPRAAASRRS